MEMDTEDHSAVDSIVLILVHSLDLPKLHVKATKTIHSKRRSVQAPTAPLQMTNAGSCRMYWSPHFFSETGCWKPDKWAENMG